MRRAGAGLRRHAITHGGLMNFWETSVPTLTQHFKMLYRNLIYTGLTRAKDLAVFVGTRRALSMAIMQQDVSQRQTALESLIKA